MTRRDDDRRLPPVLLPVPADPTVSFSVSFAVGSADDPPGKEGLAHLAGRLIEDGATANNSYEAILAKLYPLAASYGVRVDKEMTTLTGRCHADTLEDYVPLFTDACVRPAFSAEDFQRVKSDTLNYLRNTLRYSSDEELGKAALYERIFAGTGYAHPVEGTIAGLTSITLDDLRDFYARHFHRAAAQLALGGGYEEALVRRLTATLEQLPPPPESASKRAIDAPRPAGRHVLLVDKPGADASISVGFPLEVLRGERDFYALWVANSWLGEHRHQASHLFDVIREARGLNYGDYAYIEAFPEGGLRSMPPVNVARHRQIFEIWIRSLPTDRALFALRAALRELQRLVDNGMTEAEFELTRGFLKKYSLHFAPTTSARLGYAVDDAFYGIETPGHLQRFRRMMDELTLGDVNAAIRKHLQYEDLVIAIVSGAAAELADALAADAPSPIAYETAKPERILAEDREIERFALRIDAERIAIVPVAAMFSGS